MTDTSSPQVVTARDERRSGWRVLERVVPYLWPQEPTWVRPRVVGAMILLVLAKLITVATPFFYKGAVDGLAKDALPMLGLSAVALTVAYGLSRLMMAGFQQLRDAVFAPVAQRALRQLAFETFNHIHALSMRYHISRRTGGLSRIIERGVKGVEFLLRFVLFSVGPLILELLLVGIILTTMFDIWYLVIVAVTIFFYVVFTFAREAAPADERQRHRCQPEGHRQPAELRNSQVFQRRSARGRPL